MNGLLTSCLVSEARKASENARKVAELTEALAPFAVEDPGGRHEADCPALGTTTWDPGEPCACYFGDVRRAREALGL